MNAMPQRVEQLFLRTRTAQRAAFIPYICAGDPTLDATVELASALERAGADLLELGVPFSDPLADGIVNQLAAQRALAAGATVRGVLDCVRRIREKSEIPIVLYTYLNPIFQYGFQRFHQVAETAGVDALLILDLPPDELMEAHDTSLLHIALIAPTTSNERIATICARAAGFIYYVSREGVTGAQASLAASTKERVGQIRGYTDLPLAIGFGISNPEQAGQVAQIGDAVVVGSAIVKQIELYGAAPNLAERVAQFVRPIADAVHASRDDSETRLC
ncbi:MAG: tryptophan synthase subunit alpha [Verrucomicrobiota bacterium]|nr:tryptophan synthase subunit alpha [Verrucomicrobiota bacterium]